MSRLTVTAVFSLLLLMMMSPVAHAGTITLNFGAPLTVTTSADQDAALQRMLTRVNAERSAGGFSTYATIEAWLRDVLVSAVKSYKEQAKTLDAGDACATYKALSASEQATIDGALNGKSPCP